MTKQIGIAALLLVIIIAGWVVYLYWVAAVGGNRLLIGAIFDSKFLDCKM